jgi:hypothetical protein
MLSFMPWLLYIWKELLLPTVKEVGYRAIELFWMWGIEP